MKHYLGVDVGTYETKGVITDGGAASLPRLPGRTR
jgi:hypothetical protein